jgi:hypothetical protein
VLEISNKILLLQLFYLFGASKIIFGMDDLYAKIKGENFSGKNGESDSVERRFIATYIFLHPALLI